MASYPNVRPFSEPSVTTEGFRAFACRLAFAALRIAHALSELATLRGTTAMRSTGELLTGAPWAPQPAVALVRVSATTRDSRGRRVA
jgi:hypothetical protein